MERSMGQRDLRSGGKGNGMLGVLLGFVPWIIFWVVAEGSPHLAI